MAVVAWALIVTVLAVLALASGGSTPAAPTATPTTAPLAGQANATPTPEPLVADFGFAPQPDDRATFTFTDLSSGTVGRNINYFWDFDGDGLFDAQEAAPAPHTYTASGTYYAQLLIVDNDSDEDDSVRQLVSVTVPETAPPVVGEDTTTDLPHLLLVPAAEMSTTYLGSQLGVPLLLYSASQQATAGASLSVTLEPMGFGALHQAESNNCAEAGASTSSLTWSAGLMRLVYCPPATWADAIPETVTITLADVAGGYADTVLELPVRRDFLTGAVLPLLPNTETGEYVCTRPGEGEAAEPVELTTLPFAVHLETLDAVPVERQYALTVLLPDQPDLLFYAAQADGSCAATDGRLTLRPGEQATLYVGSANGIDPLPSIPQVQLTLPLALLWQSPPPPVGLPALVQVPAGINLRLNPSNTEGAVSTAAPVFLTASGRYADAEGALWLQVQAEDITRWVSADVVTPLVNPDALPEVAPEAVQ